MFFFSLLTEAVKNEPEFSSSLVIPRGHKRAIDVLTMQMRSKRFPGNDPLLALPEFVHVSGIFTIPQGHSCHTARFSSIGDG